MTNQFNIENFLEEQQKSLREFLEGQNIFVNLPIGFGKSLIFQCLPRRCLVYTLQWIVLVKAFRFLLQCFHVQQQTIPLLKLVDSSGRHICCHSFANLVARFLREHRTAFSLFRRDFYQWSSQGELSMHYSKMANNLHEYSKSRSIGRFCHQRAKSNCIRFCYKRVTAA